MTIRRITVAGIAALLVVALDASAQQPTRSEVNQLKKLLEQQEQSIRELKSRIQQLEGRTAPAAAKAKPAQPPAVAAAPEPAPTGAAPSPAEEAEAKIFGKASPVKDRGNLDDRQDAAALPGDYVLDPAFRGYIPIPRTVFMVKFNPKPRLDMMFTTKNPGDARFRFATANLPLEGSPEFGGEQFDATANGSQIRVDMRAPSQPGNFPSLLSERLLRLRRRPDALPAPALLRPVLRGRRRVHLRRVRGSRRVAGHGRLRGPERRRLRPPATHPLPLRVRSRLEHHVRPRAAEPRVDTTGDVDATSQQSAPDGGFNIRWTPERHRARAVQHDIPVDRRARREELQRRQRHRLRRQPRRIAVDHGQRHDAVPRRVRRRIGGLGNDSGFFNTDAAFNSNGTLVPLEYVSGMGAFTHQWTPRWRSTATFGWVLVQNTSMQPADAYHMTRYGSVNVIYQLFKRLSIGVEGLYGFKEVRDHRNSDDVARVNIGMVYAPFD
jgi:hypothetical protein